MKKMPKVFLIVNAPLLDLVEEDMIFWSPNSRGMFTI